MCLPQSAERETAEDNPSSSKAGHRDRKICPARGPNLPGTLTAASPPHSLPPFSFSPWRSITDCPTAQHQRNGGTKYPPLCWILLQRHRHRWVEACVKLGHHQNCGVEKRELRQHIRCLQGQSDYFWKWLYRASERGHERCWLLFGHCHRGVWNQHLRRHHSQCLWYELDGSSQLYPVFKHWSAHKQFSNDIFLSSLQRLSTKIYIL